uniref:Chromosome partition protein Smc n=1 Tax=Candidatus Kentrum eta TaxID=2126337 RepID=A0A450V1X0_9GAMM|nr:MAG: condensin subunit Smc [Candidatus Kentron sp. H]VFJ98676.1 MAG: condensin subunit Smc [Candidatus Kentron sp. H]VFK04728.1 MAG: condensin subunit Smc [Candidatus Kentron sp. H]
MRNDSMFLHKIKLAGFKSFVDPTTISLPSSLVGIVGPNGCGKSNVADAVRWVMGEISAKHLRGGSMADVVFSGSTARKPMGLASVEILLDNTEGRVGGQYASYNEISVRRQVSRDGQSSYFLNGKRCRRRDVTDVFLGTGLGPRSYAIIEQGMVSRLVEAKPDELREFLEEAAGVSKYKERRRETENRIGHTRENLERLQDIREELDKRLQHLKRQATVAEQYRELKQAERLARAQLLTLRWRLLTEEITDRDRQIHEQEAAMAARVSEQQALDARLKAQRVEHAAALDGFNNRYRASLDVGSEIARAEETIENLRHHAVQVRQTLHKEEEALKEAHDHLGAGKKSIEALERKLADKEPTLAKLQEQVTQASADYTEAEAAMQEWSASWEALGLRVTETTQAVQAEEGRIERTKERIATSAKRYIELREEQEKLDTRELKRTIMALAGKLREQGRALIQAKSRHARHRVVVQDLRRHAQEVSSALDSARERSQEVRGRLASLTALQQEALGKGEGAVTDWLRKHDLAESPRLLEGLEVAEGWERAVEHVLGDTLRAVCVAGLDGPATLLADLGEGSLTFFDTAAPDILEDQDGEVVDGIFWEMPGRPEPGHPGHGQKAERKARSRALVHIPGPGTEARRTITRRILRRISHLFRRISRLGESKAPAPTVTTAHPVEEDRPEDYRDDASSEEAIPPETDLAPAPDKSALGTLDEKVTAPWNPDILFAGIYTADDLDQALVLRPTLGFGQSIVTPTGEWLSRNWLRVHRGEGPTTGVLPREREIKTLSGNLERLQAETDGWKATMETANRERKAAEENQVAAQTAITEAERRYTTLKSRIDEHYARFQAFVHRGQAVASELTELHEQRQQAKSELVKMIEDLGEKQAARERLAGERDAEVAKRKEYQKHLTASRTHWQQMRDKTHQADLDVASTRAQHQSLIQAQARDAEHLARLETRCRELRESLSETDEPLKKAETELTGHRARRQELETALGEARRQVEELDTVVRESDQKRHAIAGKIETDRERLEKRRLARQAIHVRREALGEQVAGSGHAMETLLAELPKETNEADWTAKIEDLARQVARLGPINLAAVQEYETQSKEQARLDTQHQDLTEALATLETAIQDMDRETRTRFMETHEKVNAQLGVLFPRLFGGGQAQLELVGTDPLEAGVTIMARPPGKRNSTIAQLSGGEKALSAVALVFALFELNPAPFCLLDEVDAPLDDANVYRFRDLVKEMSDRVQFILITHNKNTMEIAHQLVGVTMSEPGVSRLVSVDIDQLSD